MHIHTFSVFCLLAISTSGAPILVIGDEGTLLNDEHAAAQSDLQQANHASASTPEVDREQPQINPPDSNQGGKVDSVPLSLSRLPQWMSRKKGGIYDQNEPWKKFTGSGKSNDARNSRKMVANNSVAEAAAEALVDLHPERSSSNLDVHHTTAETDGSSQSSQSSHGQKSVSPSFEHNGPWTKFKGSGKSNDATTEAAAEALVDLHPERSSSNLDVHHTTAETDGSSQSSQSSHGQKSVSPSFEPMAGSSKTGGGKRQKVSSSAP